MLNLSKSDLGRFFCLPFVVLGLFTLIFLPKIFCEISRYMGIEMRSITAMKMVMISLILSTTASAAIIPYVDYPEEFQMKSLNIQVQEAEQQSN